MVRERSAFLCEADDAPSPAVAAASIAALAMAGEALGFSPSCLAPSSIRSKAAPSLRMGMMPSDRREALALGVGLIVLGKPSDSSAFENRSASNPPRLAPMRPADDVVDAFRNTTPKCEEISIRALHGLPGVSSY